MKTLNKKELNFYWSDMTQFDKYILIESHCLAAIKN